MKTLYKKILLIIALLIICILLKTTNVKAASCSISANTTAPTPGQTVTVTGNVTAGAWNLKLAGAYKSETIYGYTNTAANSSASKSISFVAGDAGTTYKFTLTGDMTDINADKAEVVNKEVTIVVATPPQDKDENTSSQDKPNNSENNNSGVVDNTPKEEKKSSNANLKDFGITPNDFKGFKYGTTSYDVTVPNNIKHVEVYAFAQHEKATVTGTGFRTLQEGENALSVVVTAEDGTTKTYTVNVTRESASEEDTEDKEEKEDKEVEKEKEQEDKEEQPKEKDEKEVKENSNGLLELEIENVTISPKFDTNVYEYKVKYIGKETQLDIKTKATDEKYVVDVTGNENLKDGENIITILVSDKDGNNVATYQLTVNKSLVDESAVLKAQEEKRKQDEKNKKIMLGIVIAVAVVAIIVFFIVKNRRDRGYTDNYSEISFTNLNDEEQWQESNWQDKSSESDDDEDIIEEPRRTRHKAKRFK